MTKEVKQLLSKTQGFAAFIKEGLLEQATAEQLVNANPMLEAAITTEMQQLLPNDKTTWATDPIAQQFIPSLQELDLGENTLADPLGDQTHMPVKGIVHRHRDRCLLLPIAICALYCRFCFRKEQIGPGHKALNKIELDAALHYIANTPELFEVILSGGDPLMLKPKTLAYIFQQLQQMPHVKVIRIHTRVPVVDTARITDELLAAFKTVKPLYLVLHINHANELHPQARVTIAKLQQAGVMLLSQAVLLKNVNDNIDALEQLMRELVMLGVKPYYIHQLDPARGVDHFKVSREKGVALMQQLRERCSGLCQPLYVEDVPNGAGAKMPVKKQ